MYLNAFVYASACDDISVDLAETMCMIQHYILQVLILIWNRLFNRNSEQQFEIDLCSKCTEQSNKRRDVEHRAKQNEEKIKI